MDSQQRTQELNSVPACNTHNVNYMSIQQMLYSTVWQFPSSVKVCVCVKVCISMCMIEWGRSRGRVESGSSRVGCLCYCSGHSRRSPEGHCLWVNSLALRRECPSLHFRVFQAFPFPHRATHPSPTPRPPLAHSKVSGSSFRSLWARDCGPLLHGLVPLSCFDCVQIQPSFARALCHIINKTLRTEPWIHRRH